MENLTVTKVSLSHGMFMKVSFTEHLPNSDERKHPNVSCSAPVHEDLAKAFEAFKPDLALIAERITKEQYIACLPEDHDATKEYSESSEMGEQVSKALAKRKTGQTSMLPEEEDDLMDNFHINTVEFTYKNGIEGIVLYGETMLSTGKWLGVGPTPVVKINEVEYPFVSDLFQLGEHLKYEVTEYIINHKYAPAKDPELNFPDGPDIEVDQY